MHACQYLLLTAHLYFTLTLLHLQHWSQDLQHTPCKVYHWNILITLCVANKTFWHSGPRETTTELSQIWFNPPYLVRSLISKLNYFKFTPIHDYTYKIKSKPCKNGMSWSCTDAASCYQQSCSSGYTRHKYVSHLSISFLGWLLLTLARQHV